MSKAKDIENHLRGYPLRLPEEFPRKPIDEFRFFTSALIFFGYKIMKAVEK